MSSDATGEIYVLVKTSNTTGTATTTASPTATKKSEAGTRWGASTCAWSAAFLVIANLL
jgi:hypothetical protein